MSGILTFDETMSGFYSPLSNEPSRGFRIGRLKNYFISGDFRITISNMDEFTNNPAHEAKLDGALTAAGIGEDLAISNGKFNLFRKGQGGIRQMSYSFDFRHDDEPYRFEGHKEIIDDPTALDAIEDMTTLYFRIYRGTSAAPDAVVGAGILRFHLRDLPLLVASIQTPEDDGLARHTVVHKFFGFAFGELAQTFLFGFK